MVKLTMYVFFLFIAFGIMLATYGGILLYSRSDRLDIAEFQRAEIAELGLKVRELRRNGKLALILEQILNACQIYELGAANEAIQQKRYKEFERYEMPLLNEQELKILNQDSKR